VARPGPHTQTELAENLEKWYARRSRNVKLRGGDDLAPWEKDDVFMALALSLWPVDMEGASDPHYHSSQRMRMRLRWEGFRAGTDAAQRLEALLRTAEFIREKTRK
jgi:hypothetical protein